MTIRAALSIATAAMLVAAPAEAHEGRRPPRHEGGVGAFLAGAVIAGGLVALLASKRAEPAPPVDVAPEPSADENDAANACADAAERQMSDDGRAARVERIASVTPRDQGGYKVKGDLRVSDHSDDGYAMRFSCTVKGGAVRSVMLSI